MERIDLPDSAGVEIANVRGPAPTDGRFSVPEYWIVNLTDGVVETYTDPHGDRYRTKRIVRRGEDVSPLAFPDDAIAADDLLPQR